jgi:hypothetical protein
MEAGQQAGFTPGVCSMPAQSQGRPMRVAYFSVRPGPNEFERAFERGLRERGLPIGGSVIVDYRFAGFDADRENANIAAALATRPSRPATIRA